MTAQWYRAMLYLFLVVIGLGVCLIALIRISRAYRRKLLRRPERPTSVPDIWRMHTLPPESDDPEDSGPQGERQ